MSLLLLDITGLICRKVPHDQAGPNALRLKHYSVEPRPGYQEFLQTCYERYSVGFFSSTTATNANPILNLLLTEEQRAATILFWFRDRTHYAPGQGHETVKVLKDLFENPIANQEREWNEHNTLIVDDSIEKMLRNPSNNYLIIKSYEGDPNDSELSELLVRIQTRFEYIK